MRSLIRGCLLLLLFPVVARAQAAAQRPVTIGVIDSVWSPTLKEHRRYLVYTPPSYRPNVYQPRAYPVLYLLDGDAHFHSVTGRISCAF
ncbi:MAG TPA: hypothetical protein VIP11_27290 [Gemmatimonadaceae bacterium]